MQVPGYWHDQGLKNIHGVVWFRKTIVVPSSMAGQPARLFLGTIVDRDSVYLNGQLVGTTAYQYPPRKYNIPAGLLKAGENTLVVRVINYSGNGGFTKDKPYQLFSQRDTVDLKGSWQYQLGAAAPVIPPSVAYYSKPLGLYNAMIAPMFLPGELMLIPRFLVVSSLGLADTYAGVILPGLLSAMGIFLLRQTFASVPQELEDAARMDGCREWGIFWHVMLPAARPALAVLAIFGFISVWNSFIWPLVVLKDTDKYPIALALSYLTGVTGTDVRSLAAGTVISLIPVIFFFVLMQRHILEGMKGAVKG